MKGVLGWILLALFLCFIAFVYGLFGWAIAWVLDKGLDLNVNYSIFVIAALVIYAVKMIPTLIAAFIKATAD